MWLAVVLKLRCALYLSLLGRLFASVHCVSSPQKRSLLIARDNLAETGTGLHRTITIVTDTLRIEPLHDISGGDNYPAHSWIVFGATAEEGPLRVELVSPTIDGVSYGFAISVTELSSKRDDVGDLDFPLPHLTSRTNLRMSKPTKLRNAEIFNPLTEPDINEMVAEGIPHPVLRVALRLCANTDGRPYSPFQRLQSHSFVDFFLSEREFGPRLAEEDIPTWRSYAYDNFLARVKRASWAQSKYSVKVNPFSQTSSSFQRSGPDKDGLAQLRVMHNLISTDHIFFEARMPQPRLRGVPRRPSIACLFEIQRSKNTLRAAYQVRRIIDPWTSLLQALPPSPLRPRQSVVSLSRDPLRTSGHFASGSKSSLPQLLGTHFTTSRSEASPSSASPPAPPSPSTDTTNPSPLPHLTDIDLNNPLPGPPSPDSKASSPSPVLGTDPSAPPGTIT